MPLDPSFVGRSGGACRIVIERSAVSNFAHAIKESSAVYHDARAAQAAGFDDIPAPPTYLFVASYWGTHPERQPEDPGTNPIAEVVAEYARQGGLLLHGEQGFTFERPVVVGDVLDAETELIDTYVKGTLTFAVCETRFTDARTGALVAVSRNNFINRQ